MARVRRANIRRATSHATGWLCGEAQGAKALPQPAADGPWSSRSRSARPPRAQAALAPALSDPRRSTRAAAASPAALPSRRRAEPRRSLLAVNPAPGQSPCRSAPPESRTRSSTVPYDLPPGPLGPHELLQLLHLRVAHHLRLHQSAYQLLERPLAHAVDNLAHRPRGHAASRLHRR